MIKSVIVTNDAKESLQIDLTNPWGSGFNIASMKGIGPVKAAVNTTALGTQDGAIFNSAHIATRNITMEVYLVPTSDGCSIESIRHKSYKFFPVKQPITLTFVTDIRSVAITGFVESNEPDIFQQREKISLSIICPDPYFKGAGDDNTVITSFFANEPSFEFPWFDDNSPSLELSQMRLYYEKDIWYEGEIETGAIYQIHAMGSITNPSIYNTETRESFKLDSNRIKDRTGDFIKYGDVITISTIAGDKYVKLTRNAKEYNIMSAIDKNSDWLELKHGDNMFAFNADSGKDNIQLTIYAPMLYEGV